MADIINPETEAYEDQNEFMAASGDAAWSILSPQGQLAPSIAAVIAEKIATIRRFRAANPCDCTIAYQVKARGRARRWPGEQVQYRHIEQIVDSAGGLRQAFPLLIPPRPYCADYLPGALQIRSRKLALKRRHVQLNHDRVRVWMPFDIDRPDAYFAADDVDLPRPNFIAVNPDNGHSLSAYLLKTPAENFASSRESPLQYLAAVERGLRRRLGADPGYRGLIAKNPQHADWRVEWQAPKPYDLGELARELSQEDMRPEARREHEAGLGRNCSVFEDVRPWAYRNVLAFKRDGDGLDAWIQRCIDIALGYNSGFARPMTYAEVCAIGKSIAKWTWRNFSAEKLSARQSYLGKKGNERRWANHVAESTTEPWVALGIGRRTYYYRKKAGALA
jgi:hypothetical protein